MADRYWVGGTGTWYATSTTNWSETSGGVGGASAPTSLDDVYFDSGSDAGATFTVTLGTGAVCKDFNVGSTSSLDRSMTLAGTSVGVYGSLLFPVSNLICTYTGSIEFLSSILGNTITTNGTVVKSITINSSTGGWTLGSSLLGSSASGFNAISCLLFDTAGYNITMERVSTGATNSIRNIYLRNSTISDSGYYTQRWDGSGTTVYAGTSTIITGNGFVANNNSTWNNVTIRAFNRTGDILGNNLTFNVLRFNNIASTSTWTGAITCNDLILSSDVVGSKSIFLSNNVVVNNSIIAGSSSANNRWLISSNSLTATRTISASTTDLQNIDFRNIVASGSTPWTGVNLGDCGNNSNIVFSNPKTVYWNLAGSQNWSANAWALTSGGTPSLDNFPLPQDTCIFDNAGAAGTVTLNANYHIGAIDFSQRTNAITIASGSNSPAFYKNVTLSSAVTVTGTGTWNFLGTSIQEMISSGRTIAPAIYVRGAGIKLIDAFSNSENFILTQGSLDLNEKTLTCGGVVFSLEPNGTLTRSINFGTNGFIYLTRQDASFVGTDISNFTATDTGGGLVFMNGGSHQVYSSNLSTDRSMAINVRVAPSSRSFSLQWQPSIVKNLTFDEGYTGVAVFRGCRVLGNLVLSTGMTVDNSGDLYQGILFQGESQTLKTNGVAIGCPIRIGFGWLGGTASGILPNLTLLDDLNITRSTDTSFGASLFTLERGTLNLNGKKLIISTNSFKPGFDSSITNTRNLIFNGGSIEVQGNISPWTVASSNLSVTGPGSISLTSSSAKTFAGGGANYSNVILNQGGLGELTITGNNQFGGVSNTVRPASIKFTANSTTTLGKFMLNGSEGSPVTLSSTTTGTRYTLTSPAGVHAPYYASIRDANATGGATWRAPTNYGNVDAGNNLGWDFSNINILTDNFMVLFPSNLHFTS